MCVAGMNYVLIAIIALAILFYAIAPLIVLSTMKLKQHPTILSVPVEQLPQEAYEYFAATAPGLIQCGFEVVAYIHIPDQVPNAQAYLSLWINRGAGQCATAVTIYAGQVLPVKTYLEFLTKVTDGIAVLTNNAADLPSFKKVKSKDVARVPQLQDPCDVYRVQLAREARLLAPADTRYLPAPGDEVQSLAEGGLYELLRQARVGWLKQMPDGDFRPRLHSAYVMTLGELPPFKQLRRFFANRAAEREIQLAAARQPAAPSNVRITHESPYRSPPLD
jgi:hypothetical protein